MYNDNVWIQRIAIKRKEDCRVSGVIVAHEVSPEALTNPQLRDYEYLDLYYQKIEKVG